MTEFFETYKPYLPYIYFAFISTVAFIMIAKDKRASKKDPKNRTPEAKLFSVAILGGSVMMYTAMLICHHKTKHLHFMIGIPVIMALQFTFAFALLVIF